MLFGMHTQHSHREAYQVADSLTMYDLSQSISLKMLNLVPKFLPLLPIFRDSISTSFPRCFLSKYVLMSEESQNNRGKRFLTIITCLILKKNKYRGKRTTLKQIKHKLNLKI